MIKSLKYLTLISGMLFQILACFAQSPADSGSKILGAEEFKRQIGANATIQLVDVRTPKEFKEGAIDGAINIDFLNPDFEKNIEQLDKSKPVYIYCRSGGRSGNAAKNMKNIGFIRIYDLKGGFLHWTK